MMMLLTSASKSKHSFLHFVSDDLLRCVNHFIKTKLVIYIFVVIIRLHF